jgi:CubicO group peptidase (beta-lactamase class C family)
MWSLNKIVKAVVAVGLMLAPAACQAPFAFASSTPYAEGVNEVALNKLLHRADETHTDALVILKNGKLLGEWYFGKIDHPIPIMSMTKSISSLGTGRLIDIGKIKSLDQPVFEFYPEWNQGRKRFITVRQLLNHTSGIQSYRSAEEIYASPDFVKFALAAELSTNPGKHFFYNNKAINLLSGISQAASGNSLDQVVAQDIFAPLGISEYTWEKDKAGNPIAMADLSMRATDLAKVGQLIADDGVWDGRQVISKSWLQESFKSGQSFMPTCGLLWWLIPSTQRTVVHLPTAAEVKYYGLDPTLVPKLVALNQAIRHQEVSSPLLKQYLGRAGYAQWQNACGEGLTDYAVTQMGPIIGVSARGEMGQRLIVFPADKLVVVRLISEQSHKGDADDLPDLLELSRSLIAR